MIDPTKRDDFSLAFARLIGILHHCFIEAESSPNEAANGARLRQTSAQRGVADFFHSIGLAEFASQFNGLASALYDLDEGITHPLLKAVKIKGGRRRDRSDVWRTRLMVVAAVECYRRAGQTETQISKKLAKKTELTRVLRLGKATSDSLKTAPFGWAEQFKSGTVRDPIAIGMWQVFSARLVGVNNFDKADWQNAGDDYLSQACHSAASKPHS